MDLKQLTPTQLAVGAGLLVLLLVLLLLLWLLGRSRGKARRRRERTEAALSDAPTAALAAPPTEPTPTQPPTIPPPPGPVRPPQGPGSESGSGRPGSGRPGGPDQPGEAGLTMFGSTPQSRGPYRVVQYPGEPNQPRTAEPHPNDRLAAEQQRHRYATPPQPRASMEPTFDQPEPIQPPRDSERDAGSNPGPDFVPGFGSEPESSSGAPSDLRAAAVGWPRSGASDRAPGSGTDDEADRTDGDPDSRADRPTGPAPADRTPAPEPEPTTGPASEPTSLEAGHPERNGLAAVPEAPAEGNEPNTSPGDAKDRLLRVLLADPDRALHAVGDLEASRNQLDRLNDSVHYQRRQLADAARRLRGAGLTPAQVAQLAGFGEGELVSLLSEHAPSPTPRTPDTPPTHS